MKTVFVVAAAGCASLFSLPAPAQAFFGGAAGLSDIDDSVAEGLIDPGGRVDGEDTGFKVFGGYMFSRSFGLEAAYADLGRASYSGSFFGDPVIDGKVEVRGRGEGAERILRPRGELPAHGQRGRARRMGVVRARAERCDTAVDRARVQILITLTASSS